MNSRSDTASTSHQRAATTDAGRRRSTRTAVVSNGMKRSAAESDPWTQWRGERRSARLGAPPEALDEPPSKRARTEDTLSVKSGVSDVVIDSPVDLPAEKPLPVKHSGAAAVKPTEVAMEQIIGRKKSRFWYYAVEPVPASPAVPPIHQNGNTCAGSDFTSSESTAVPRLEGSLSPAPSMDED